MLYQEKSGNPVLIPSTINYPIEMNFGGFEAKHLFLTINSQSSFSAAAAAKIVTMFLMTVLL
jgi:hypothetical protein